MTMEQMEKGQKACVDRITVRGIVRRRLQDIGLIPGTVVECRLTSGGGEMIAYLIRGAVIALRREDASQIQITPVSERECVCAEMTGNGAGADVVTERVIALVGNPNVGKSTVFNALTGGKQHTGNWSGKTVAKAEGCYSHNGRPYRLVDLPGTYSLYARSAEEEVTRDYVCFGSADAVIIVCDASCLERNLNLVLQVLEIVPRAVVCVNLMDEAAKQHITVDLERLEERLGVPVVGTSARNGKGLEPLKAAVERACSMPPGGYSISYPTDIETYVSLLIPVLPDGVIPSARWTALRLPESTDMHTGETAGYLDRIVSDPSVRSRLDKARKALSGTGSAQSYEDRIIGSVVREAQRISALTVKKEFPAPAKERYRADRLLTGTFTGIPVMLMLLCAVFWITIYGANIPSGFLFSFFHQVEQGFAGFLSAAGSPVWLIDMTAHGILRVLFWVVSVMLPPMAIFFPLFTLLEDLGYLPRIAFNLDRHFKKAHTCGKQALTMAMGFGCNAAGITGCRIIDSPRERLIAILTNSFVPCNGRFPTLILLITLFFAGTGAGDSAAGAVLPALMLTGLVLLGIFFTFAASRLLSLTILKGVPSAFTLELPPYRVPQIGKVIVRSLCDRTLFVLGRAALVAAPAGLIIWLLTNIAPGGESLLAQCAGLLDPLGRLLGMDGVILLAFILGFPASEIVVPIIIMAYTAAGTLGSLDNPALLILLTAHGWNGVTALCTMVFCLFHWPCSTSCITVYKETGSFKWTLAAFLIPTGVGMLLCFLIASAARIMG